MKITVKLFATLRENREKIMELEVSEATKPSDIAKKLDIPLEEVAIVMVNGRGTDINAGLSEGDVVALFPPVGGG